MKLTPKHINKILRVFDLTPTEFAKFLNVAPFTVSRWLNGENAPTGAYKEVLNGLYNAAVKLAKDPERRKRILPLMSLGLKGIIFTLLKMETDKEIKLGGLWKNVKITDGDIVQARKEIEQAAINGHKKNGRKE